MKILRIALAAFCMIGADLVCRAQERMPTREERPDLWKKVQDTVWICVMTEEDAADSNQITGAYRFERSYDSLYTIFYTFGQAQHRGRRLKLLHWQNGRRIDMHEDDLRLISRTEDFTITAGDTIGFYRSLDWYDPVPGTSSPEAYLNRDTLLYIVELARSSDSARILPLDTIGALPRRTPGLPHILDGRAIMDAIRYVVPPALEGTRVFLRVRVEGSEEHHFTRIDGISVRPAFFLNNLEYMMIQKEWVRRGLEDQAYENGRLTEMGVMTVEQQGSSITVRLEPTEIGPLMVDIRGAHKERMYILYNGMPDEAPVLTHWFPSNGTYYITAMRGRVMLQLQKIVVDE